MWGYVKRSRSSSQPQDTIIHFNREVAGRMPGPCTLLVSFPTHPVHSLEEEKMPPKNLMMHKCLILTDAVKCHVNVIQHG